MMRSFFYLMIMIFLSGCNDHSRVVAKHYYYSNGNLKETVYGTKVQTDSTVYYYEDKNSVVKTIKYWKNNNVHFQKDFFKDGKLMREGFLLRDNFRIGKWNLYAPDNYRSEVVEYFDINNEPYVNQSWKMDNHGDTLVGGNYFSLLRKKDTVRLSTPNRFHFYLNQKALNRSEIFVCIPRRGDYITSNFSNEFEVIWDTISNMAKEFKNHPTFKNWKYDVMFELMPSRIGNDTLKGFLLEKELLEANDTVDFITRKIYFKIPYYVRSDES